MTIEAAETLVANSSASSGSMGSTQRCEIPALNPARARSWIASRDLGRKPLDLPALAVLRIAQPVVQAVGASLPELDPLRNHAVAAPMRRTRRFIAVAPFGFFHQLFELAAGSHRLALLR